jgi:hypothetical protein
VVLKQLRPKCRAAVELRFTQGLSYREIAMHLGVLSRVNLDGRVASIKMARDHAAS